MKLLKPNRKNSKLCSMPEIQSNSRKISCSRFLPSPHPLTPLTQQHNFHILRVFPLSSITMWLLFILWIRWSNSASRRRMKQVRQAVVVLFVCTCEKDEWASEKLITSFDACSPHLLESRGCSFLVKLLWFDMDWTLSVGPDECVLHISSQCRSVGFDSSVASCSWIPTCIDCCRAFQQRFILGIECPRHACCICYAITITFTWLIVFCTLRCCLCFVIDSNGSNCELAPLTHSHDHYHHYQYYLQGLEWECGSECGRRGP